MQSIAKDDEEWEGLFKKHQKTETVSTSELEMVKQDLARLDASQRRMIRENFLARDNYERMRRENDQLRDGYERVQRDNDHLRDNYERMQRDNDRLRDNYERLRRKQNAMCQRLGVTSDLGRIEDET